MGLMKSYGFQSNAVNSINKGRHKIDILYYLKTSFIDFHFIFMSDAFHSMMDNVTVIVSRVDSRKSPRGKQLVCIAHPLDASPELVPVCNLTITKRWNELCAAGVYLAGLVYTELQGLCISGAYCSPLKNFYYVHILWGFWLQICFPIVIHNGYRCFICSSCKSNKESSYRSYRGSGTGQ